jgi:hypothetical protein
MVKVLENRVVDLDILPGTKEEQEAAAKAKCVILLRPTPLTQGPILNLAG